MKTVDIYGDEDRREKPSAKERLKRLAIAAACIALVYGGLRLYWWARPRVEYAGLDRQEWRADMEPGEYFPPTPQGVREKRICYGYNDCYDYTYFCDRYFSHQRERLVSEGLIPDMDEDYIFTCGAYYLDGGGVEALRLSWGRGGQWSVAVAVSTVSSEAEQFLSTYNYEHERDPLVTERDGVDIVCVGDNGEDKCMRYYKDGVWYQIYGRDEATYEEMVKVLDFFFENPVDFTGFSEEKGALKHVSYVSKPPKEFQGYYPTRELTELCPPMTAEQTLYMLDEDAYRLSISYEWDVEGTVLVGWDVYDMRYRSSIDDWYERDSAGRLEDLTREDVAAYIEEHFFPYQNELVFSWGQNYVVVAALTNEAEPGDVWELLRTLREEGAGQ